jgi:Rhomboid family/zinc-ribbon domain
MGRPMSSGADLFVVCKQCGSEVSPYVTECPYCGSRLRRRAPKLPRVHAATSATGGRGRLGSAFGRGSKRGTIGAPGRARAAHVSDRWAGERPYATMLLVAVGCVAWIVAHAQPDVYEHMAVVGPLGGDWWKLFASAFVYTDGVVAFVVLFAVALFGWLLERRHGPAVVVALFGGASVAGALVALAAYPLPIVEGANAGALALLCAWAVPDLEAARAGEHYEGDLLGTAAIAALLLAIPFVRPELSWVAGVTGGVMGLVVGAGVHRLRGAEA